MAKDVTTFLNWAAEPELDERHKLGLQGCTIMAALWFLTIYVKRYKWTPIKARKIRSYLSPTHLLLLPSLPSLPFLSFPADFRTIAHRSLLSVCLRRLCSLQPSPSFVSLDGNRFEDDFFFGGGFKVGREGSVEGQEGTRKEDVPTAGEEEEGRERGKTLISFCFLLLVLGCGRRRS
jgi:hypothetical protein